jgi:hypothetical protein
MSHPDHEVERIDERALLLPEELAAGSDDPEGQAAAILAESDDRTDHPSETRAASSQTDGTDGPSGQSSGDG